MQQHYLHRVEVAAFQHIAQMQRIAQSHIGIAVAIPGMELYRKLLLRSVAKSNVEQIIDQRLVRDTQFPVSYSQLRLGE